MMREGACHRAADIAGDRVCGWSCTLGFGVLPARGGMCGAYDHLPDLKGQLSFVSHGALLYIRCFE